MELINEPIAVVGISCLFPECGNIQEYWSTIVQGKDHIKEIPLTHWNIEDYYHEDPKAKDKTYAKTGAFLKPYPFNPLEYGITPSSLEATDTTQLLGMVVSKKALEDAGYGEQAHFDRDRVSCILGVTGTLEMVIPLGARLGHPAWRKSLQRAGLPEDLIEDIVEDVGHSFVGWQEASFPGLLGNVVAGRIANRLNLGGTNSVVDAACASSLSAIRTAVMELQTHRADMVVTGGMDTFNDIFMYMCFSKTPALSPTGSAKPFDSTGDGTVLGEGLGAVILKRLSDAEKDGNRIYGVIRSIGSSSDGKGKAIYAPSAKGQVKALKAAYQEAAVSPSTIELIECHGTGTRVGDGIELEALNQVYREAHSEGQWCTLGSVKSQIGHTKAAAGVAGFIKAILALYHKVLPPTIKVQQPHSQLEGSPFIIRDESCPWPPSVAHPRRAAVSAFGFGGSNFHAVLEEYQSEKTLIDWPADGYLLLASACTTKDLQGVLENILQQWPQEPDPMFLRDQRTKIDEKDSVRLALFSTNWVQIKAALERASLDLKSGKKPQQGAATVSLFFKERKEAGKVAVLFSGQGSQYPNMLGPALSQLPATQKFLDLGRAAVGDELYHVIFPGQLFTQEDRKRAAAQLAKTSLAQPAIGVVSAAIWNQLKKLGVESEMYAGHSFGELTACFAAGCCNEQTYLQLAHLRGQLMEKVDGELGGMTVLSGTYKQARALLDEGDWELVIANHNAPQQVVISGLKRDLEAFEKLARLKNMPTKRLVVGAAFHSPVMANVVRPFYDQLREYDIGSPQYSVYSNVSGKPYDLNPEALRKGLSEQLAREVKFVDQIKQMYDDGARTFIEIGPSAILANLVKQILPQQNIDVFSFDDKKQSTYLFDQMLAKLFVAGCSINWNRYREDWQAAVETRPAYTIPISGANYRNPDHYQSKLSGKKPQFVNPASQVSPPKKIEGARVMEKRHPEKAPLSTTSSRDKMGSSQVHQTVPSGGSPLEKHLLAIQEMQMQNAALHKQFLENQSESQKIFYEVLKLYQSNVGPTVPSAKESLATDIPMPTTSGSQVSPLEEQLPAVEKMAVDDSRIMESKHPEPAVSAASESSSPVKAAHSQVDQTEEQVIGIIASCTGYPEESLNPGMDLEEDLGIDSIKRVEIFSKLQEVFPRLGDIPVEEINELSKVSEIIAASTSVAPSFDTDALQAAPAPEQKNHQSDIDFEQKEAKVLQVISEKTGYPLTSLNSAMNLEEDLGIDSIKRVEIISHLQEMFPSLAQLSAEDLAEIATINELIFSLEGADDDHGQQGESASGEEAHPAASDTNDQDILSQVLETISVKTGYPLQSLHADMSLEEDLGIDSIKRVEILSSLGESYIQISQAAQEDLAEIDTVAQLVAFIQGKSSANDAMPEESIMEQGVSDALAPVLLDPEQLTLEGRDEQADQPAQELGIVLDKEVLFVENTDTLELVPLELPESARIWVSDDGSNLARNIVLKLRERGFKPKLVSISFVERMEAPESLDGLIILGPLKLEGNPSRFLQNCFKLVRLCAPALKPSTPKLFATISRNEGMFGLSGVDSLSQVFSGALAGLSKTAREEWPHVRCLHLDLGRDFADGFEAATRLIDSCLSYAIAEIGVHSHHYSVLRLAQDSTLSVNKPKLNENDVLLITGGGRGVTAAVAMAVAQTFKCKLLIWGRTDIEEPLPSFVTGEESDSELKKKILDNGLASNPKEIQESFNKIRRQQECLQNIKAIKAINPELTYKKVDCSSEPDIRRNIENCEAELGTITGVIHGAGVLADKLIEEVADDDFAQVIDTKVRILPILEKKLNHLKLLCMFSSSTARFGRKGQVAYAIANEALNKFVQLTRRHHSECLALSFNWGPWDGGMVNAGLKKIFSEEGLGTIPLGEGAKFFVDELFDGRHSEIVLIAKPLKEIEEQHNLITLDSWPILKSHVIKSKGVVPAVLLIEHMIAAAKAFAEDDFLGFQNFKVLKGITVGASDSFQFRVDCKVTEGLDTVKFVDTVFLSLRQGEDKWFPIASLTAVIGSRQGLIVPDSDIFIASAEEIPEFSDIYDSHLFHGEDLQGITGIRGLSSEGVSGTTLAAPKPEYWFKESYLGSWYTDPLALDVAFQLAVIWSERMLGNKSLPIGIKEYRQFQQFPQEGCEIRIRICSRTSHQFSANIEFVKDEQVIAEISGYEAVMDESLAGSFQLNEILEPESLV